MPWIITRLCIDKKDMSCVESCPVDCIYEYTGDNKDGFPNQIYIDPDECIDCGACEPVCPWEAIFEESAVPNVFIDDIELNRKIIDQSREVPEIVPNAPNSPDEVEANKAKWGLK